MNDIPVWMRASNFRAAAHALKSSDFRFAAIQLEPFLILIQGLLMIVNARCPNEDAASLRDRRFFPIRRVRLGLGIRRNWTGPRIPIPDLVDAVERTILDVSEQTVSGLLLDFKTFRLLEGTSMGASKSGIQTVGTDADAAGLPDKETVRGLVSQAASFATMFGYLSPRFTAIGKLLAGLSTPDMWERIWGVIESNPTLRNEFASLTGGDEINMTAAGQRYNGILEFLADQSAGKSPAYYSTRSGIMGILMMAQGWAWMTRSQTDDAYVMAALKMFQMSFDEWWSIEHPNE